MTYELWLKLNGLTASAEARAKYDELVAENGAGLQLKGGYSKAVLKLAQEGGDEENKVPTVDINLYNGKPFSQWWGKAIVDIEGVSFAENVVLLWHHDHEEPIGHSTGVTATQAEGIWVSGILSAGRDNPQVARIVEMSKNGFPWQSSMGATIKRREFLEAGEKTTVNGNEVEGPLEIAREVEIYEASILPLGADSSTSTSVAASKTPLLPTRVNKEKNMDFKAWLQAKGFELAALTDEVKASLKKMFEKEIEAEKQSKEALEAAKTQSKGELEKLQLKIAEMERVDGIKAACGSENGDLQKKAIEDNWSVSQVEASVEAITKIRADRETPAIHIKSGVCSEGSIEASMCSTLRLGREDLKKGLSEEDIEAGQDTDMGIHKAARTLLMARGSFDPRQSSEDMLRAALTTTSLLGILANVANKKLRAAYAYATNENIGMLSSAQTVADFKIQTWNQIIGNLVLEKVPASGEVKHGESSEASTTFSVDQYAKQYNVDRKTLINDDLNAFDQLFAGWGRGAATAEALNFWGIFIDNGGSFYHADNNNLVTSNALSIDGVIAAMTALKDQTDPNGYPIFVGEKMLLVCPPALEATARQIAESTELNETGSTAKSKGKKNVVAGMFDVVSAPWLNNAKVAGGSATSWFLMADPMSVPAFVSAHLRSAPSPTVRMETLGVGTLGMGTDCVYDFGAATVDYRGIVKNTA